MSKYTLNPYSIAAFCIIVVPLVILFFASSMPDISINYKTYHVISALILTILLLFPGWIIKNLLKLSSRSERRQKDFLLWIIILLTLTLLPVPVMMLFDGIFTDMMSADPSNSNQFIMAIISIAFAGLVKILDGTFQTRSHMLASAMLFIFAAVLFFVVGLLASNVFQHTAQYQYIMIVFFAAASTSLAISIVILFSSLIKMFHQQISCGDAE